VTLALIPAFSPRRRRNAPNVWSHSSGWIGVGVNGNKQLNKGDVLSRGRVALLGIAQRQIRASRVHIPTDRYRRKSLPTSIKTLGDLIQIKRYEKRLTLWEVAQRMGIPTAQVRAWERDDDKPNEQQTDELAKTLGFKPAVDMPEATVSDVVKAGYLK